jgi:hypothetical protein
MKLYLHNFLIEISQGKQYYPLKIVPGEIRNQTVEFNSEFIASISKRMYFSVIQLAAVSLGLQFTVPSKFD